MIETIFNDARIAHCHNQAVDRQARYPEQFSLFFGRDVCRQAGAEIRQWPDYAPTPLLSLEPLARELGIGGIYYKDEGGRFGLGSFKSLGGAYEVLCLLQQEVARQLGGEVTFADIRNGRCADLVSNITVVTATDGNHGRSVAWGAQQFGCQCVVYLHAQVSAGREASIAEFGARVVRVAGNYDASVQQAADAAAAHGWFIVSDTSYAGYTELPRHVMAGYTVMVDELLAQLPAGETLSHAFIQGGVGGLAGALCGAFWQQLGGDRPRLVIVEPDRADCLFQSAQHGGPTDVQISEETIMAGLSCGRVSALAWTLLSQGAEDFLAIPDALVAPTMRLLAQGAGGPTPIVAGESAVAGLAALIAATRHPGLAGALGLDEQSRVLLIGTEGATDPVIYENVVGRTAAEILAAKVPGTPGKRADLTKGHSC